MGSRTAQHRPGLSQLIDPGFYAQSGFNFKILCFAWTVAAISGFFLYSPSAGISHLRRPHCSMPFASSSCQCHSDIH
jgi:hypothetical protein